MRRCGSGCKLIPLEGCIAADVIRIEACHTVSQHIRAFRRTSKTRYRPMRHCEALFAAEAFAVSVSVRKATLLIRFFQFGREHLGIQTSVLAKASSPMAMNRRGLVASWASGSPHVRRPDERMCAHPPLICRTAQQADSIIGPKRHRYHGSAQVFASAARPGHVIVSIFHSHSLNIQVIRTVRRPLLQNQTKKRNPPPIAPSTFSPRSSFLFSRTSITRSNAAIRMARKRVPQFTEKATMYRGPPEYM